MFSGELAGVAGHRVVIEDFWRGEEVSFIAICDGEQAIALPPAQDHKAIFDGDQGSNTGGMGAYSDDRILSPGDQNYILEQVIGKTLRGMAAEGNPFRGFLFAGLMMTSDGPKVLEFNVRLGDPETQCLMTRLESGFVDSLLLATQGKLAEACLNIKPGATCCVVLAAQGYPAKPKSGDLIRGVPEAEAKGTLVFQAGTKLQQGNLLTAGGRVLGVTAGGDHLTQAIQSAYAGVAQISFDGMQFRKDIGEKGLKRYTGERVGT
jgi:phosphoribosylamine--glycine ligase